MSFRFPAGLRDGVKHAVLLINVYICIPKYGHYINSFITKTFSIYQVASSQRRRPSLKTDDSNLTTIIDKEDLKSKISTNNKNLQKLNTRHPLSPIRA